MTNDLKNFLEETEEAICGNCHRYTKNEARDTRLINFVLDLVEKEVEKNAGEGTLVSVKDISTIINQLKV